MNVNSEQQKRIADITVAIRNLQPHLEELSIVFRKAPHSEDPVRFDKWSHLDWCRIAFRDASRRLCQMIDQNFIFIEMMGLLAVARYIFELSIWLRLFRNDARFGLVYYRQLMDTQLRYYQDTADHLRLEVKLLESFAEQDSQSMDTTLKNITAKETLPSDIGDSIRQAMDAVDAKASREFSLYLDDAKINGYSFQAHLVEKQAIPQTEKLILTLKEEIAEFQRRVPPKIQSLVPKRWNWKDMANKVKLTSEYDYIYCYSSKLLHATPSSLTTNHQNLQLPEVYIFLRYIYSKLLEIIDLAQHQPEYLQSMKS